jgi:hypothetical protein
MGFFSPAGETVIDLAIGFNADVKRKQSARRRDTALPRSWLVEKGEQAVGRGGVIGGGKVAQDHADALTRDYFLHVADLGIADTWHSTTQVFRQFGR